MSWSWKFPRFRMWVLLVLVALIGLGLGIAREYWGPNRVWRRLVRSSDSARQAEGWAQAFKGLIDGLSPDETMNELIAAMGDDNPTVRSRALTWYRFHHRDSGLRLPLYIDLLKDPSSQVRSLAAEAVGDSVRTLKSGRELVVPPLLALLKDPDPRIRAKVLMAIGEVIWMSGRANDPLLEVVADRLDDPRKQVWLEAAYVLARSGTGEQTVPRLMATMLKDRDDKGGKDSGGTGSADNILVRLANRSPEVVPFLLREAYRPAQGLSNRFLFSLQLIDGPARKRAFELAEEALVGGDDDLRVGAALFLEENGRAKILGPTWLRLFQHPDPDVRHHALNSFSLLDRFGRATRDAIRSVRDDDPDPEVRKAASDHLWVPPGVPDPDATPRP